MHTLCTVLSHKQLHIWACYRPARIWHNLLMLCKLVLLCIEISLATAQLVSVSLFRVTYQHYMQKFDVFANLLCFSDCL